VDNNSLPWRPLTVFLSVAFGGSILLSLMIGLTGGYRSPLAGLRLLTMFVPAVAVLVAWLTTGAGVDIEWNRFPLRWLPVALLILPLCIHALALPGVVVMEGRLPWANWLTADPDGLYHTPPELGWGTVTLSSLLGRIAINAMIGLFIVSFLAVFEEIGWRAFMLPRLVASFGIRRGAVASALIFALWHVPYQLLGIQHVENVPPVPLALISPLGEFGAGLFLAYIWLKTGSLPLVSLAHGSLNNWGQYAFKFMNTSGERDLVLFALVNLALLFVGLSALTMAPTKSLRSAESRVNTSRSWTSKS
jgi:membrane protease YdiL (CAAX protease family)